MGTLIDLKGQTFGYLTVLERDYEKEKTVKCHNAYWKCQCKCGSTILCPTSDLKTGHTQSCGCSKSKGEEKIAMILSQNQINFIRQKSFADCISNYNNIPYFFDFYLPDYNILIEYDGIQHFKYTNQGWNTEENYQLTQERDAFKNQWAQNHNVPLVRISYLDFDNLSINFIENKIKEHINDSSFRFVYQK